MNKASYKKILEVIMPNSHELENSIPVAPLRLIIMDSARTLGNDVNKHLVDTRI